jgi:hypothetical protein
VSVKFADKKIFPEKIIFDDLPPPRRQKNFGQCTILGVQKFFVTYYKFSKIHKIYIIFPIFLYSKPIFPDCEANIA